QFQERIVQEVTNLAQPTQLQFEGMATPIDVSAVVAKATELIIQQTIDIPRILIVPKGEIRSGFRPFTLELDTLNYQPVSSNLWIQHLRTSQIEIISTGGDGIDEVRLEDYIVKELMDFDDVDYDTHADFLYDLASQVVRHFQAYLPEEDIHKVLRYYQKHIARFVHTQMQEHYWEEAVEYEVKINRGFTELKKSAFTLRANEQVLDFRLSPSDKSNMAKYLFGGFDRCLYPIQKFQSDSERKLAIILDRDSLKWLKPAKGQFQIFYRWEFDHLEYQPDFVAETTDCIYLVECKARNEMEDPQVIAKRDAATEWCRHASEHAATYQGKPWKYLLIPHDLMAENMTLTGLVRMISLM
ncbi:MAG TPA: type III restriction endonuclease subunit R, partial [Acidobacteriota bacterium]|nr:type III restriction endonuclease subunit R [Acidobacteriota bacterium]